MKVSIERWYIVICFIFLPYHFLLAKEYLAVLHLDAQGLSEMEASILTDRLRSELFQTGEFEVIEREKMNQILSEQNFQMSGCTSEECLVKIGQLIGVEQIVGGTVSKFGNLYSISIRLIDVETGKIVGTAVYDHRGEIEGLLYKGVTTVANKLAFPNQANVLQTTPRVSQTEPQPSRSSPATSKKNSGKAVESWYTYWALGGAGFNYPVEIQDILDYLESTHDVNRTRIALDILGFYFPLYQSTLIGFIINGGSDQFEYQGETFSIDQSLYSASTFYFIGGRVGSGTFFRGDLGSAYILVEDSDGNSTKSKTGIGLLLGGGYAFDLGKTQILLGASGIVRSVEDEKYSTFNITVGGLF